jgi:hypothetical protein
LPGPVGAEFPQPMAGKKSAPSKTDSRNLRISKRSDPTPRQERGPL